MRAAYLLVGIIVGACTTAAVQSSAEPPPAKDPQTTGSAQPWMPAISPVVVKGDIAEVRNAPGGKGRVTILARGHKAFVARLEMPGGGAVPEHRDATEEYIVVQQGGGTITVDGTPHTIEAGDTVYMPADAQVSYQNGPDPLVALQVFAGPEPAAKYGAWAAEHR